MVRFSIILPTLNEAENLPSLTEKIFAEKIPDLEVLIVDDHSSDDTEKVSRELEKKYPGKLFFYENPGKKGLSPSVVFGFSRASGGILLCMDADGQHRPEDLPGMLAEFGDSACQMVIGSRHVKGGGFQEKWNFFRVLMSRTASWMAHLALKVPSTDPMSGFFAIRKDAFEKIVKLMDPDGFKVMLEMLFLLKLTDPEAVVREHGITFALRKHGKSKISGKVIFRYLAMLCKCMKKRCAYRNNS